jgi:hypothetical protein
MHDRNVLHLGLSRVDTHVAIDDLLHGGVLALHVFVELIPRVLSILAASSLQLAPLSLNFSTDLILMFLKKPLFVIIKQAASDPVWQCHQIIKGLYGLMLDTFQLEPLKARMQVLVPSRKLLHSFTSEYFNHARRD